MDEKRRPVQSADQLARPATIPVEAYVSRDYAAAEQARLWRKAWLQAGRIEDIPQPGDFITFEIGDDSVIVLREDAQTVRAFHNVCVHRGRRLVDVPAGQRNARGNRRSFICGFHGWA